jgi:hypothetical protein
MPSTKLRLAMRWLSSAAAGTHQYPFPAASELSSVARRGRSSTAGEGTSEPLASLVVSDSTQRRNPLIEGTPPLPLGS